MLDGRLFSEDWQTV